MSKSNIINLKKIIKTDLKNIDTFLADRYIYYDKIIEGKEYLNLFKVTNTVNKSKTSNTADKSKTPKKAKKAKKAKTI